MDLRASGRTLSLITLPLGLCVFPLGAVLAAVGFIAVAPVERRPLLIWPTALVWLTLAMSTILSGRLVQAGPVLVLLALLGALLMAFQARLQPGDLPPIMTGLALAMLVLGGRALVEVFVLGQPRALAGQFHGNVLGALAAIAVPMLLASCGRARPPLRRVLLAAGTAAGLVALILSGSRGALLAIVLALAIMLAFTLARSRPLRWIALGGGIVVVASLATVVWFGARQEYTGRNLLVNAGFEFGAVGWELGGNSSVVLGEAAEGNAAIALVKSWPGTEMLLRGRTVAVVEDSVYTLSMQVRIDTPIEPGFVRFEALDASGTMIARAGREGWTAGLEVRAGGPMRLPAGPIDEWRAVTWTLPETPPGTDALRLALVSTHPGVGHVALVDALQLEAGRRASAFEAGPAPGLADYLGPLARRLPLFAGSTWAGTDRSLMAGLAMRLIAERPFLGHGLGAFREFVTRLEPAFPVERYTHSHNLYLELLLDGGSLLLVVVLALVWLIARALCQRARVGGALATAALGVTMGVAVHSAFDVVVLQPFVLAAWWLGVVVGLMEA